MFKKGCILTVLSVFLFSAGSAPLLAAPQSFNPSYIISDDEILDYMSMSLSEIQSLLTRKGGYLSTYKCKNPEGKEMTAAEVIYDRAITNKVNPKFIIVLLQKEQSLIEEVNPTARQLDWATGYGCPDGDGCNPRWQGFWKQINSASLQFRDYMDNPHLYTYRAGATYTFTNPYGTISKEPIVVTPVNQATAALYNYTPHVYNGNFNFHKIWNRYFTRLYFDGSLLQAKGEPGVWFIEAGKKRPILSKGALSSRFDTNKIITVNKSDLEIYEKGLPIKFPQYSIVRSPKGTIYLLVDDIKRGFASGEAFRKVGVNPEEVVDVNWEDLSYYTEGNPITASSTYTTGALLQNKKTGGVFYALDGTKAPIWDAVFLKTKFRGKKIIPVSPAELDSLTTVDPVRFGNGEILKTEKSSAVYVIVEGKKKPVQSAEAFLKFGFKWDNIIIVSAKIMAMYEDGEPIADEVEPETPQASAPVADEQKPATTTETES